MEKKRENAGPGERAAAPGSGALRGAALDPLVPTGDVATRSAPPEESLVAREVIAEALAASVDPLVEPESTDPRLEKARLVVLDVDGVLTDGRVVYGPSGPADELQAFHVQDGIAILWLLRAGLHVAWVTGRGCAATRARAAELGVVEYHERVPAKRATLTEIQERLGVAPDETVAMGDDLPDLGLFARAGFCAAPANAVLEIRQRAHLVTRAGGGAGAVRELAEHVLRAQGRWQGLVEAALT